MHHRSLLVFAALVIAAVLVPAPGAGAAPPRLADVDTYSLACFWLPDPAGDASVDLQRGVNVEFARTYRSPAGGSHEDQGLTTVDASIAAEVADGRIDLEGWFDLVDADGEPAGRATVTATLVGVGEIRWERFHDHVGTVTRTTRKWTQDATVSGVLRYPDGAVYDLDDRCDVGMIGWESLRLTSPDAFVLREAPHRVAYCVVPVSDSDVVVDIVLEGHHRFGFADVWVWGGPDDPPIMVGAAEPRDRGRKVSATVPMAPWEEPVIGDAVLDLEARIVGHERETVVFDGVEYRRRTELLRLDGTISMPGFGDLAVTDCRGSGDQGWVRVKP